MTAPPSVWVLGAGRLGRRAAGSLREKYPESVITIIDACAEACARMEQRSFTIICREGVEYLFQNLQERRGPDWIVPMIPVHVACEWIRRKLEKTHRIRSIAVPPQVADKLPNPMRGAAGQIYMSNANFRCPWNCPEPDDNCTFTGKPRPRILHQLLEKLEQPEFQTMVLRSRQLAPGVGGYPPAALFHVLKTVSSIDQQVLLSTACRCHGVMHAFEVMALF